jgi:hypothetical protein
MKGETGRSSRRSDNGSVSASSASVNGEAARRIVRAALASELAGLAAALRLDVAGVLAACGLDGNDNATEPLVRGPLGVPMLARGRGLVPTLSAAVGARSLKRVRRRSEAG